MFSLLRLCVRVLDAASRPTPGQPFSLTSGSYTRPCSSTTTRSWGTRAQRTSVQSSWGLRALTLDVPEVPLRFVGALRFKPSPALSAMNLLVRKLWFFISLTNISRLTGLYFYTCRIFYPAVSIIFVFFYVNYSLFFFINSPHILNLLGFSFVV